MGKARITESVNIARRAHKMFRYSHRIERRANTLKATDRRAHPRFSDAGQLQQDRRIENRMANIRKLRKSG